MSKSLHTIILFLILLLFSACSSTKQFATYQDEDYDFKTSKKVCTKASNLSLYTSVELHKMLLQEAKEDILFEFLNTNSTSHNSYSDLAIFNKIDIKKEFFDLTDDFSEYCLEVDAVISNTQSIYDEMKIEDFCQEYMAKGL